MQTFILVMLMALGVHSHRPSPPLRKLRYGVWSMMKPVENIYYQNSFSKWNPQLYNPNDHVSFDNAEWICRAPKTGDMLVIIPGMKYQSKDYFHNFGEDDYSKEYDMKNHSGEGFIEGTDHNNISCE